MLTLDGHQKQLNQVQRIFAYQKLMDTLNLDQTGLAKLLGVNRVTVCNCVNFRTKLCGEIMDYCLNHKIDLGYRYFRTLTRLSWHPKEQFAIFLELLEKHWSVLELEQQVNQALAQAPGRVVLAPWNS
jgi:hypothetical protein